MNTPRTDKLFKDFHWGEYNSEKLEATKELCKELETELTAADAEIAELRATCSQRYYQIEELTKRAAMAEACLKSWKEDEGADAKRFEFAGEHGYLTREEIDEAMEANQ